MALSIVFIITSIITFIFIILKIRKNGLNINDSIIWILWAFALLILSFFPQIPTMISNYLGFMSTSNFIFSIFIFFLYILLFIQAIQISKLKEKINELIQKLSIKEYEDRKKEK
ncbi:DUF2304 domain-containing protein [Faecalicoccus acidiformans]|uniref:DUF2304 domain-containing protein n=1 Tax=Faecalicoccus acidiformans TaxID=915173 RepID=UPI002353CC94|nr:DUF2304 domain-containing protein [Faecalicoccus acidiformans]MDM8203197.1 DUF2304 domain-containing protein [Faecalicoccus acidiformans]